MGNFEQKILHPKFKTKIYEKFTSDRFLFLKISFERNIICKKTGWKNILYNFYEKKFKKLKAKKLRKF